MFSVSARERAFNPLYCSHPFSSSAVSLPRSPYMQSDLLSTFLWGVLLFSQVGIKTINLLSLRIFWGPLNDDPDGKKASSPTTVSPCLPIATLLELLNHLINEAVLHVSCHKMGFFWSGKYLLLSINDCTRISSCVQGWGRRSSVKKHFWVNS